MAFRKRWNRRQKESEVQDIYQTTSEMKNLLIKLKNSCPEVDCSIDLWGNSYDKTNYSSESLMKEVFKTLNYLALRLKKCNDEQIHKVDSLDFEMMSMFLFNLLPALKEPINFDLILYPCACYSFLDIGLSDKIIMHLIDPEELLAGIDINDFSYAYNCMVNVYNDVNPFFDNAFLKIIEHKGNTWKWHLDWLIIKLLNSKIIYKICIGLKFFKTCLKVHEIKHHVTPDFCFVVFDLSQIPEMFDSGENELARFVAGHAKDCHDLLEKKGKLATYRIRYIFSEIIEGATITQCQKYHELDEEMRYIDKHFGQEFGGFSLEVVANDDMKEEEKKKKKPLCASDCMEKSSLNKYFFYDDAMKTLSMLSFMYNYVEKYGIGKEYFKIKSYVTKFVITLIHQHDLNKKIDKPIWIMEKILNTCHFIVFGNDEEKEKDIFLKLMIGEEIDENELSCLKDFMVKNKLSYEDGKRD